MNINVSIEGYMTTTNKIVELKFDKTTNKVILNNLPWISITIPNSFNGKEVVLWLTKYRSSSTNNETIKASISNYSTTLTLSLHHSFVTRKDFFEITSEDITIEKIMYSQNFYDFDSEQYHKKSWMGLM